MDEGDADSEALRDVDVRCPSPGPNSLHMTRIHATMNGDVRGWADWARSQGWSVEDDAKGYTRFHDPEGRFVGYYPATPSRPSRRLADLKVALRKAGLEIPPPTKKERRARRRREGT